jgi:predicted glycoside hydrolase/deacetylase ChbG (UPF0249 family)
MVNAKRRLIVNADDFGRSAGVNRGIIQSHEHGIVTSASLMVRWPASIEAALYGVEHSQLSLGLHIDLSEMTWRKGAWVQTYQVVAENDSKAVRSEVLLQLECFRRLTGNNPSHLDSHQQIHENEPVRSTLSEIADWLGIPLRGYSWQVRYCGDFYGQDSKGRHQTDSISVEGLQKVLAGLEPGVTELSCHPGEAADLDSMYRVERSAEIKTLCDPRVRRHVEDLGIELCSFNDLDVLVRQMPIGAAGISDYAGLS